MIFSKTKKKSSDNSSGPKNTPFPAKLPYPTLTPSQVKPPDPDEPTSPNAFTFVEALISLLCSFWIGILCVMILQTLLISNRQMEQFHGQFALIQLRNLMMVQDQAVVEGGKLYIQNGRQSQTLYFDKGRIVKTPGYEIFLENVQQGQFIQNEEGIFLECRIEKRKVRWQIASGKTTLPSSDV